VQIIQGVRLLVISNDSSTLETPTSHQNPLNRTELTTEKEIQIPSGLEKDGGGAETQGFPCCMK
jgi:hypothetical protein